MPRPVVEVVGLGPGDERFVTDHTRNRIAAHRHRFVRTARHPSAHLVGDATSFDDRYECSATFDEVYTSIVDDLAGAAAEHGAVLYAVPGSPLVLERTVRLLMRDPRIDCVVNPAIGFLELAYAALGIDPVEERVTLVDGHSFAASAAGLEGPLLVAHCHANWVLSEIKLSIDDTDTGSGNDDLDAVLLHHLGLPDEQVVRCRFADIDRTIEADHLTSLYLPRLGVPVARDLSAFHELARTLRRECPWDREQTHHSLVTYLLEETHEVVDAILALDPGDPSTDDHLVEELGDLLYQIEFHAAIAEQEGRFTMADVARGIHDKLVRRHPHLFAPSEDHDPAADAESVLASWEEIKAAERAARGDHSSQFDSVPRSSGSLSFAAGVLKKAEKNGLDVGPVPAVGVDFDDPGSHLLAVVAECRRRGVDPEVALREVVNRLVERHSG